MLSIQSTFILNNHLMMVITDLYNQAENAKQIKQTNWITKLIIKQVRIKRVTHHWRTNCCNMGATSWGQTKPSRPIVMATGNKNRTKIQLNYKEISISNVKILKNI